MDKRVEENRRVKRQIASAYFSLLRKCSPEDAENISVKAITDMAKVSRMAYYRNFNSKADIVRYYVADFIWGELAKRLGDTFEFWTVEYGIRFFEILKAHRELLLLFDRHGYSGLILELFNEKNEELAGDMPRSSIKRYNLYYAAGASFNAAMIWLKQGCKETPLEMAQSFALFASPVR